MGRGQRRKTSIHTNHIVQRKVKTNRRKSVASVKAELENELKDIISNSTIRHRLHEVGLYGGVARKKPYISKVNRHKSLQYTKNYRKKHLNFRNKVLW